MSRMGRIGKCAVGSLLAAACMQTPSSHGESYSVGGDPWGAPAAGHVDERAAGAAAADPAKGAGSGATPAATAPTTTQPGPNGGATSTPVASGSGTVLEQLDAARTRADEFEKENRRLSDQVASLTAVVEGLKRDNANLAQLVDSNAKAREGVDGEISTMTAKIKELELRALALADDLLSERIKRVRVERQLILAKVAEAESEGDGN
jgi:hypothetical protein